MLRRIIEHPILSVLCFSLSLGFICPWILQGKFSYSPGIISCTCVFLTLSISILNVVYCFCSWDDEAVDFNMKFFEIAGAVCGMVMFSLLCFVRGVATGFNYLKALTEGPIPIASEWVIYVSIFFSLVGYITLRFFSFKIKNGVIFAAVFLAVVLGIVAFVMSSIQYGKETVFVHVLNGNAIIILGRTVVQKIGDGWYWSTKKR